MKLFLKIIILIAALFLVLKSCSPFLGTNNSLVGQPAPDFTLETLSGRETNMTRFRNGQPAIIFFWATWCPHCRTQLEELTRQHAEIEENGIKVILVDVGESTQKVRNYVAAKGIPFDVFLDQDSGSARDYRIIGVPTFFFVDKEGIVVAAEHFLPDSFEEILSRRPENHGNTI